jgi:hypothetical protein
MIIIGIIKLEGSGGEWKERDGKMGRFHYFTVICRKDRMDEDETNECVMPRQVV